MSRRFITTTPEARVFGPGDDIERPDHAAARAAPRRRPGHEPVEADPVEALFPQGEHPDYRAPRTIAPEPAPPARNLKGDRP